MADRGDLGRCEEPGVFRGRERGAARRLFATIRAESQSFALPHAAATPPPDNQRGACLLLERRRAECTTRPLMRPTHKKAFSWHFHVAKYYRSELPPPHGPGTVIPSAPPTNYCRRSVTTPSGAPVPESMPSMDDMSIAHLPIV